MASQVSPGVVLRERDLTNSVIVGDSALTAAFASSFQKGPIGEIVNISSGKALLDTFGSPKDLNAEDWLVANEFLGYGGRLAVVRANTTGTKNATSDGAGVLIKNESDWAAGIGGTVPFSARSAGTWGNSLKVVVVDRGADQLLTLASAPATTAAGTSFTTIAGKAGRIYSWDSATKQLGVILDKPSTVAGDATSGLILATDTFDEPGDGVATGITTGAYAATGAQQGTHTVDVTGGDGSGLRLQIVIDVNGVVTGNTIVNGGTGYTAGNIVTAAGTDVGGASPANDIPVTINTVSNDNIAVDSVKDWYTNTTIGTTGLKLAAVGPRPGTSEYASSRGISYDEIHIAVIDTSGDVSGAANTIIERFTYLSKLSDGKSTEGGSIYYKDVLNEQSGYVYHGGAITGTTDPASGVTGKEFGLASTDASWNAGGKLFTLAANINIDLSGGVDNYTYTAGQVNAAYDLFLDTEETEVDFVLMGGSYGTETDTLSKANKVVAIAAARKDCIAFVSPFKGNQIGASNNEALSVSDQRTNTLNFFNAITSTSFAVLDSGYKYMYDRFNDKYRYVPCNGDVAGLCVNTSTTNADWISPAGMARGGVRNVVKLAYNPNKADRDELYQNRVNPIVTFPGSGAVLFGDKTALASPSAFDRINVRRLFLNVEKRVEALGKGVLFEINDETTRSGFLATINGYLNDIVAQQGITDFLVVCDSSNNTADVIDRNEFVAELFIKPARSINYVTVTFTATRTGVSFSEVVGR